MASETQYALDAATRAQIFRQKILPAVTSTATTQEHPRAIVLAGQPGAGKGGLTAAARAEFGGNAIVADPDELRKFHPQFSQITQAHPLDWGSHTHPDASAWATELRAHAVAERQHLIVDSSLARPEYACELTRDLQGAGYAVEVHAIATPQAESDLGVYVRFLTAQAEGKPARFVPQGFREQTYPGVAASLAALEERGVPAKVFDRQGNQLYASAVPGPYRDAAEALRAGREAPATAERLSERLAEWEQVSEAWTRLGNATTTAEYGFIEQRIAQTRQELHTLQGGGLAQAADVPGPERPAARPDESAPAQGVPPGAVATVSVQPDLTGIAERLEPWRAARGGEPAAPEVASQRAGPTLG